MGLSALAPLHVRRRARDGARPSQPAHRASGQALAELALLLPLFVVLLMALFEFALAFNAMLNTNYASRAGGLTAAEAGNQAAADCLILDSIEKALNAPTDVADVSRIDIQRTNPSGTTVYATSSYSRSGSTTCSLADGSSVRVPYRATSSGYPPSARCNVLPPYGCPTLSPARTTVDTIAVQITYVYRWQTPLKALIGLIDGNLAGTGYTFTERNVFRMEPIL